MLWLCRNIQFLATEAASHQTSVYVFFNRVNTGPTNPTILADFLHRHSVGGQSKASEGGVAVSTTGSYDRRMHSYEPRPASGDGFPHTDGAALHG